MHIPKKESRKNEAMYNRPLFNHNHTTEEKIVGTTGLLLIYGFLLYWVFASPINVAENNMKNFVQITFNLQGDNYHVFFLDGKFLFQGDYYHDKINQQFEGIQAYLFFMKEEHSHEQWYAETKDSNDFWDYDYIADEQENLEMYLKRIEKDFNVQKQINKDIK